VRGAAHFSLSGRLSQPGELFVDRAAVTNRHDLQATAPPVYPVYDPEAPDSVLPETLEIATQWLTQSGILRKST